MYRTIVFLVALLLSFYSCHSAKDDNIYFYEIDKRFSTAKNNHEMVQKLCDKEYEKYKKTGDIKYLISSKYGETFIYSTEKSKKRIASIYELLKINNNRYIYINIACNFNLAYQFEYTSPKLSLQFLDEAIRLDEKFTDKNLFLPHLYNSKGRWYYNRKNYPLAILYFKKALKNFGKNERLYIASMHNNLGMCYEKIGNFNNAIQEGQCGINILESKRDSTEEETNFLYSMKLNQGIYYYRKNDYLKLENYALQGFNYYKNKSQYSSKVVNYIDILLEIYRTTNQKDKEKEYINFLFNLYPKLENINNKIDACEILQNYYSQISDIDNLKIFSEKLLKLNKNYNEINGKELYDTSDALNGYIIKNINQKYDYKIAA